MRRLHKIIIIYAALQIIPYDLFSQNFWQEKISIQSGFSLAEADKRTDFLPKGWSPIVETVKNNGKNRIAIDIYSSIHIEILKKNRFYIKGGLGLLLKGNSVKYPINLKYFDVDYKILIFNNLYIKSSLYIPIDFKYYLDRKRKVGLISTNTLCMSFHKLVRRKNAVNLQNFEKWTFEPSDLESFIGMDLEKNDIQYFAQVRAFNVMFKDDALSNNGQQIDIYNPLKFRLGMGIKF
ncbi:MAG TPA: hypothetical protein PLZ32_20945 [Saprospiraceae bacterium]|nr:hypothetical protein [Saprospiraceae bacterium]